MVEAINTPHPFANRLIRLIAYLLAGGIIAQFLSCLGAYILIGDTQASGMVAHLLIQHLSNYFLGGAFIILSLANILIGRGLSGLKKIRMPALMLILATGVSSILLIPRMEYLRETALLDGMPVMLSPFANYFVILNSLTIALVIMQIICGGLIAWSLSNPQLTQVTPN
jgi:hypothetical protein